ncbi:hypothetical protein [Peribacillus sp. R9-11]|uniref:hypothetical protein n=1 Tax=Peribacillus sp. R9-11 TaxID=3073271 RepID=UPI002868506B|nr:hypothetical protein [Peribacillus sp. R9-11]WMX55650.1 hypothetical protein RE409_27180 [Peribacillus sp. R9-11]
MTNYSGPFFGERTESEYSETRKMIEQGIAEQQAFKQAMVDAYRDSMETVVEEKVQTMEEYEAERVAAANRQFQFKKSATGGTRIF